MSFPLYGNVIADASKHTGLGGTLTITNSCKSTSLNNQASIAFAVADISFGTIKRGFFRNNVDSADARITAVIDTVSPTVGTAMTFKVSSDHSIEPREALRITSSGNVGIGTQNPSCPLDVIGNLNVTDTILVDSLQFSDDSTQISAKFLTPENVQASDYIQAPSIETSHLNTTNLACETISISEKIIDTNNTGIANKSFIYDATTMCHKDAIINYTPLVVSVGHKVSINTIGLQPDGPEGISVASINSTNRSMTFSGTEPGGFTLQNAIKTSSLCAIISTNSFVSYDNLSVPINYVNKGIRGTGTSSNQPFVNSVTDNYTATTPTASLSTSSITTTKRGYINSNGRLVSLDTFPNQNFISMTGTSNPSYTPSSFGTNEFNLLSRNAITPNSTTGSFSAVAIGSTQLAYNAFGGVPTDFITQDNNISAGTKSTNNTVDGILTLSLSHSSPSPVITSCEGYVIGGTLRLETPSILPIGRYIYGSTTNGIPQNINSFISAVPTAPSSTYTIKKGTGTATLTNTSSSGIIGYVRSNSSKFWVISTTQQTNDNFIEGTGIPQATRMKTPTSPFVGQSKIMELSQINGHTITASQNITAVGMVSSTSIVKLTTNPALSSSFVFENASNFNELIPNGSSIILYSAGNNEVTSSSLTAQAPVSSTLQGYMRTSTLLEVRGLGNSTARLNWFFTGSGIGSVKNYVSSPSNQSPFTLASTNTAATPSGSAFPGYTKYRDSTSFELVLSASNSTPFRTTQYFIYTTSSPTLPENTSLSLISPIGSNNSIVVSADYSTYTTANVTAREPTIEVNPTGYKAYATSTSTYYVLENITAASTNYIDTTKLDGTPGFAPNLTQRGTIHLSLYTTSATLTATPVTSTTGAVFNGGGGNWYYCSKSANIDVNHFLVLTTILPQTSVIFNSGIYDKGSNTISKLRYRTVPTTASTPVANTSATTRWYIHSNSVDVGDGFFETEVYFFTPTRVTTLEVNQFFINSVTSTSFNNHGLNGAYIVSFTVEAPAESGLSGAFKATLRGKNSVTATSQSSSGTILYKSSGVYYRIRTDGYTPGPTDFVTINNGTKLNYSIGPALQVAPGSNEYEIPLAYNEGPFTNVPIVFRTPVTSTATLLQPSTISTYESQNLVVYTAGSTYSYYTPQTYTSFSPINFNFYNQSTYTSIVPQTYTIQTPLTYSYVTPLTITDYGRTTLSFYNTGDITFSTSFDINLPPASGTNTLVGDNTIQTLTNKSFDTIGLQTITTQTSTQLGYRISNKLSGGTSPTSANTWSLASQITLASQGVYLLSYSFTSRTTTAVVLMGALTLSNSLSSGYSQPVVTTVTTDVFAFCGQTNVNANYNTCANTYIYQNTSANVIIYLYWAASVVNQVIQGEGSYFQAVRIA